MARNKYPEETVEKILDVATELFVSKGYEKTTIQDIVNNLNGLSRGAIYHHFKSKDDIIDAVAARMNHYMEGQGDWQEGGTALERLRRLCLYSIRMQTAHSKVYVQAVSMLDNPKMMAEQLQVSVIESAPELVPTLEEGMADGSMQLTVPPLYAAEVLMLLLNVWCCPRIVAQTAEDLIARFEALGVLAAQMGVPFIDDEVQEACRAYAELFLLAE